MPFLDLSNFRDFPVASSQLQRTARTGDHGKGRGTSTPVPPTGFDFTRFLAAFDNRSDVSLYLPQKKFEPARFLANLRVAASPILPSSAPPSRTSSLSSIIMSPITNIWSNDANNNLAGPSRSSARPPVRRDPNYERRLEEREQALEQLNDDLASLELCLHRMEEAGVDGVAQLKQDLAAAKTFIFDAVANCNVQALDVHIELNDDDNDDWDCGEDGGGEYFDGLELLKDRVRTPPPPSPRMKPIPLPEITPGSTPRGWGRATPVGGLGFRIVATPRKVGSEEAFSYFCNMIPPSPLGGPKSPAIRSGALTHSRSQSRTQSYSNLFQAEGVSTPKVNR